MHWWSHPVYGLNVSLGGQLQRPLCHGSNFVIKGTFFPLSYICGWDEQKVFAIKSEIERLLKEMKLTSLPSEMFAYISFLHL
jgi:hypothetical protein